MTLAAARHYSDRLGTITAAQWQSVAARFDLGRVVGAEPITEGLFGQIVAVVTTEGRWVFRGNPHGVTHVRKERRVAEVLAAAGIPAPWPYMVEEDISLFGWPYAVMAELPGRVVGAGEWGAMAERDRVALSEVVGAFTQPMHAACAGPPARFAQDLPDFEPTGGSITDMADERLSLALAWSAMEPSTIAEEDRAWLFGIRSEVDADLRAAGSVAGFVHHDYKLNNVLVSGGIDRGFTVTGVVDLQEGYIGDRVQDLARTVNHADRASARAFVEASGGAGERLRLYSAIDSSALWDYGRRNHVWFPEEMSFQDYARPLVDRVAAIL